MLPLYVSACVLKQPKGVQTGMRHQLYACACFKPNGKKGSMKCQCTLEMLLAPANRLPNAAAMRDLAGSE